MPAKDTNLRPRLTAAATKLREINEPDLADAIDTVLAPNGWGRLRRSDPSASLDRNMAMRMPIEWREQIKERAEAARKQLADDEKKKTLADDVNEGLQKYLDGEFAPFGFDRNPRGSAVEMVNLNVRAKDALREAVQQQEDGSSAALVASAYLMSKYKVGPYAPKKPAKK
ncbi:hypothetical protein [Streptomyces sp. NBC_01238]|uniref:hypothetical protein n=1 Tax=Streptomyces sp. NBC_01238 TaxID=2903791 RepID=UPI002F909F57